MAELQITNLEDDLSFGARVRGVTIENVFDEGVREQLRQLFVDRGMIVFEDIEQTNKMHVELSKVFGPLKDHPTSTTPRKRFTSRSENSTGLPSIVPVTVRFDT